MEPKIIIHGGIESVIEIEEILRKKEALDRICCESYKHLAHNSAVDAVEYAIKLMEDDPLFNAGTGAIMQSDAVQRMDASIMDGYALNFGAVAQIRGVRNPIAVARMVMEKTSHLLLCGEEAQKFAYLNGVQPYCTLNNDSFERWKKINDPIAHGTVGAAAIDEGGHIAAGTSTGGWATSLPGRIGDVPIIGAGTYADKLAGVSCTGHGEKIMAAGLARMVSFHSQLGISFNEAAERSIECLKNISGSGGFIAMHYSGNVLYKSTYGAQMPTSFLPG